MFQNTSQQSLFGQQPNQNTQNPSLFGQAQTQSQQTAASSLFGAPQASQQQQPAGQSLFGAPQTSQQQSAATSLFGAPQTSQQQPAGQSLFGPTQTSQQQQPPAQSLPGAIQTSAQQQNTQSSLFGGGLSTQQARPVAESIQQPQLTQQQLNPQLTQVSGPNANEQQQTSSLFKPQTFQNQKELRVQIDKQNTFESQGELKSYLGNVLFAQDKSELDKNSKQILQILNEGANKNYLLTYAEVQNNEIYRQVQDQEFKWSPALLSRSKFSLNNQQDPSKNDQNETRKKLSPFLIDKLLVQICTIYSLKPQNALTFLNLFFQRNIQDFDLLNQTEQRVLSYEKEILNVEVQQNVITQKLAQIQNRKLQIQHSQYLNQLHQSELNQLLSIEQQEQNNSQSLNIQFQQLSTNRKSWLENLNQQNQTIRNKFFSYYMQERVSLYENILLLVRASSKIQTCLQIREQLVQNKLITKLIQSLKRNLEWDSQEFTKFENQVHRESCLTFLQREQLLILQIIYELADTQNLESGKVEIEISHLTSFYEFMQMNSFSGHLFNQSQSNMNLIRQQEIGLRSITNQQRLMASSIMDLSILTFFIMLRIDVFVKEDFTQKNENFIGSLARAWVQNYQDQQLKGLVSLVKNETFDSRNSLVILALMMVFSKFEQSVNQNVGSILQFDQVSQQRLFNQEFIVELERMMKGSYLFEIPGIQNYKNRFLQLLTDFIDLIYEPVFGKRNNYDDEDNNQKIIKHLTYGVILKNPILLDQVWSQILQNEDQSQIKCTSVMKIFNEVFIDPLNANNLQFFTFLMKTMAGKNGAEHGKDVFKFLQKYNVQNQNRGGQIMNFSGEEQQEKLMDELLCYWIILLNKFLPNQQQANQEQFDQLSNLIVIFSKIIKQENKSFVYINSSIESIVQKSQIYHQFISNEMYLENENDMPKLYLIELLSDESKDMGIEQILLWQDFQNDGIQFTLRLLMQSLFAMISLKSPEATQDTVKHLLDAIAKIFNNYNPLKKTIIDLILIYQNQYGFKLTNEILNYFSFEKEGNFKVTSSYLNFMIEVFKLDSPHLLLTLEKQTKISDSLLSEMINIFYTEIINETQKLSNLHIKQYTKLTRSLFELTYVLLSKFDSGNTPKNRIDAMQPCPFFDPFLNIIFKALNEINLNFIIQPLELQTIKDANLGQIRSNLEIVENKFITKIIQQSKSIQSNDEQIRDGDLQVTIVRVKSMIIEGLSCLTQLFRLATQVQQTIQQDQQNIYNQTDIRGVRLIYASKLQIVQKLIKIVFEQSQQLLLGGEEITLQKYNIINLVTFYIKADIYFEKQNSLPLINESFQSIHINIQATSCLKEISRLFLTQPISSRINLAKLELNTKFFTSQDIETIFMRSLSGVLTTAANTNHQSEKKPELNILLSRQLVQTFELFTICCNSQKSIMELILNQDQSFNDKQQSRVCMLFASLQNYVLSIQGQLGFQNLQAFSQKRVVFTVLAFLQVLVAEKVAVTASPQRSIYHQLLGQYDMSQSKQESPSLFLNYLASFFIGQICTVQGLGFCDRFDLSFGNPIYECDSFYDSMDYYCQQQIDIKIITENNYQLLQLQNHVLNILSISEFLKLIQALYFKDSQNNKSVNLIIKQLLTEQRFNNFFVINPENITSELQNCLQQIKQINEQLKMNSVENMSDQVFLDENQFKQKMWKNILDEKIIADSQQFSQKYLLQSKPNSSLWLRNQTNHNKTQSEEFSLSPVYISNLSKQFQQNNQNLDAMLLLQQSEPKLKSVLNDSLFIDECGNLGGNFLISATDIKQTFLANGLYSKMNEINNLISLSITYNLLTSSLFAQNILHETRNNFILSIVDSKYKESKNFLIQQDSFQIEELNQDLLSQALLVFVNENYSMKMEKSSQMFAQKDSQFEKQNQLKKLATIFTKILQQEHQILKKQLKQNIVNLNENNHFIDENTKNSLNLLQTILGYLNLCFSQNKQSDDKIHNDMLTVSKWSELKLLAEFLSNEFLQDLVFNYQQIRTAFSGNDNQVRTDPKQLFVFIQLALSSLKILQIAYQGEPLDLTNFEDQCAKSIQLCLPKIIDLVAQYWKQTKLTGANQETSNNYDYLFIKYLEVLSVVSKLLSEKSILELFYNDQSHLKPIELVFQRLKTNNSLLINQESLQKDNNNFDSEIDIKIEIIHFLILHSEKSCGAAKLYKIGILTELTKLIQFYGLSELNDNSQIGFKSQLQTSIHKKHYLWKRILLLIRTITKQLLPIAQPNFIDFKTQEIINSDSFGFLSKIVTFIQKNQIDIIINKYVQKCFPSNVGPTNNLSQLHQTFLEEIDLLTGICSRLMFYEQELGKQSYGMLHGMKDSLLFGMNLLLMNINTGRNSNIIPSDDKEHTLQLMLTNQILNKHQDNSQIISSSQISSDQSMFRNQTQAFSLFDLKTQILQVQIFMQLNCAIYNLLQKDRELEKQNYAQNNGSALFPTNWDYLYERLDNTRYEEFEQSYMCKGLGNYLKQLLEKQGQNGVMQLAIYLTKQNYQQMQAIQKTWEQNMSDTTYLIDDLKKSESDVIEPQILLRKALIVSKEVLRLLEDKNQRTYLQ